MASTLGAFGRRMRRLIAPRLARNADEMVRRTAVAVNQTVTLATPVDTGRARGNWQAEVGRPLLEETDRLDPGGATTVSANNVRIAAYSGQGSVFLSNNVPYINRLNQGHSAQAPAGFVEISIAAGVAAARRGRLLR